MSEPLPPLKAVLELDRTVHEPARLCVLAVLASVASADFVYVQKALGLTGGNLSTHLAKLSEAGLVEIEKGFVANRPRTTLRLTSAGKQALAHYRGALKGLLDMI